MDPLIITNLQQKIITEAQQLGFQDIGFSDINLQDAEKKFQQWAEANFHGSMSYMTAHGLKRTRPELLVENTLSIISVRMNYLSESQESALNQLNQNDKAYISRYALGRDYHKLLRKRLQQLTNRIKEYINEHIHEPQFRVFVDSAPVLEKPIAEKAGLGWIGKHTNLINKQAGSWFFLGEIYTNIPFQTKQSEEISHCGTCDKCIKACPTDAIISPYQLDARKCISYLTIEHKGIIPVEYRQAIGNRIYGCDDCQLVCPWNKFTTLTIEKDFQPRHQLDKASLVELFQWTEAEFLKRFEGSPIRRIGYSSWIRNISVALGNYLEKSTKVSDSDSFISDNKIIQLLRQKRESVDDNVKPHIDWALTFAR